MAPPTAPPVVLPPVTLASMLPPTAPRPATPSVAPNVGAASPPTLAAPMPEASSAASPLGPDNPPAVSPDVPPHMGVARNPLTELPRPLSPPRPLPIESSPLKPPRPPAASPAAALVGPLEKAAASVGRIVPKTAFASGLTRPSLARSAATLASTDLARLPKSSAAWPPAVKALTSPWPIRSKAFSPMLRKRLFSTALRRGALIG
jgi:hypothetical protein